MFRDSSKNFGDLLLKHESIYLDVVVCYLKLVITTCSIVKFKDIITYIKLSSLVTMFEEAFAILVMKNSLNWLIYFVKKDIIENKILSLEQLLNDKLCNESPINLLIKSLTNNNSFDSIPEILC